MCLMKVEIALSAASVFDLARSDIADRNGMFLRSVSFLGFLSQKFRPSPSADSNFLQKSSRK